jgi:hypothetical protein
LFAARKQSKAKQTLEEQINPSYRTNRSFAESEQESSQEGRELII